MVALRDLVSARCSLSDNVGMVSTLDLIPWQVGVERIMDLQAGDLLNVAAARFFVPQARKAQ